MHYFENKGLGQSTITWHVQYTCFCQLFFYFFFFLIFLAHLTVFFSILLKRTKTITLNIYEKKTTLLNITFVIFFVLKFTLYFEIVANVYYIHIPININMNFLSMNNNKKSLVPTFTFLIISSATLNVCYSLYQVPRSRIWTLPHT